MLMDLAHRIDQSLRHAVTRRWTAERRRAYVANLRRMHTQASDSGAIQMALDQIRTKATGILTQSSMMIAALGIISNTHIINHTIEEALLYTAIIVYLGLAIVALRCLRPHALDHDDFDDSGHVNALLEELVYERELARRANSASMLLTFSVLIYFPLAMIF